MSVFRELTRTEGTGDVVLAGRAPGAVAWAGSGKNGQTVRYSITENGNVEIGTGLYSGNILQRSAVQETIYNGVHTTSGATPIPLDGGAVVDLLVTNEVTIRKSAFGQVFDVETEDPAEVVVKARTSPGGVVRFPAEIESAIAAIRGTSGLEFQATATHLQWRTSDVPWTNLVSLADISGTDFTTIQWRVSATHLQWMYDGVTWVDVVPLSSLGVSGGGGQTTVVEGAGILVSASGSAYTVSNNDRGSAAVAGHEAATNPHSQYALTTHTHTGYAPTSHTHTIANVSGLQSALDAKQGSIVVSSIAPSNPVEGQLWVQVA